MAQTGPDKALYNEETFIEAITLDITTAGVTPIIYGDFAPDIVFITNVWATRNANTELVIHTDGVSNETISTSALGIRSNPVRYMSLIGTELRARAIGADQTNQKLGWAFQVIKPNVFEKIVYGIKLDEKEEELAREYKLREKLSYGKFRRIERYIKKETVLVAKKLDIAAGKKEKVGLTIHAEEGERNVITSISAETPTAGNQIYYSITRDPRIAGDRKNVVYADCYALHGIDYGINTKVVSYSELVVSVENKSAANLTDFEVRFTYETEKINLIDKVARGVKLSAEDKKLVDEFALADILDVGIYEEEK